MTDRKSTDDIEVPAAGLALGLLDADERAEAMRRQLSDPIFASQVRAWQQMGDHWLEGVVPVEAPDGAFDAIAEAIAGRSANQSIESVEVGPSSARLWRGWALTATAASLVLALGLGWAMLAPPQVSETAPAETPPTLAQRQAANVAQIDDADGVPLVSALYDPGSGQLSLRLADLQEPGLAPELWVIPQDGVPRSLGMLQSDRVTIAISSELRAYLQDGAAMAITLEPTDGKRHDAPTGDILGAAVLQEVPGGQI